MERTENVEKLMTTTEKLGFSKDVQKQVREHMNNGLAEFAAFESMQMGENAIDYRLNFGPSKDRENPKIYLNSIDVVLDKAIVVPHKVVLGYDTNDAENLLKSKPREEMVTPFNKDEFDRLMFVYKEKAGEKMQFLSEHAPEVFNALYVKYRPEIEVKMTPEMQKQQQELQKGSQAYNTFSTYYNLTKLEMYNAMNGGAIFKTLFKVNRGGEQQQAQNNENVPDNKYKAWVQVDFEKRRDDGSFEMKMFHEKRDFNLREVLREYNFSETNERFSRQEVVKFLEKGSKFQVTNLSETGEKQVLIRANPEFKNIDVFKLNGEPIRNAKIYLRNPRFAEVSDVVSLTRSDTSHKQSGHIELTTEKIMEKASRFQSAKDSLAIDQKKSTATAESKKVLNNASDHSEPTLDKNKPSQNGTIERRTRNSSRTVADSTPRQGLKH